MVIKNDPVRMVLKATKNAYGSYGGKIYIDPKMDIPTDGFLYGETIYSTRKNGIPLILLSSKLSCDQIPKALAHELAHIISSEFGLESRTSHGDRWQEVYQGIMTEYEAISDGIAHKEKRPALK